METSFQQDLLNQLSMHISSQIGIYFPPEQTKILEKKILPALPELGFKDLNECLDSFLQKRLSKLQLDILAKHLTIGETYFFRDKSVFTMLKETILPEIKSKHQDTDRTIRIWSAACATGEEPYSIAILLKELIPNIEKWYIQIIGTDLNILFLNKARMGCYKAWSFRQTPKDIIDRYFHKEEKGEFALIPEIKQMVQFAPLNLMNESYGSINPHLKNCDLILCNNVLIYFSKDQIRNTVKKMTMSLALEGWLYVSSVEVPFISDTHLIPVTGHRTTAFKKIFPALTKKTEHIKEKSLPEVPKEIPKIPLTQGEFYECCLSMYTSGFYSEVIHQLTQTLTPKKYLNPNLKTHAKEVRLLVHALANLGKFADAKRWCETTLAVNKLDKELHYLYATILQEMGDEEGSLNALRSALYIDSDMIAAHFSMAMLLLKKKNNDAKRHLDLALAILKKMPPLERITGMENITCAELTAVIAHATKGASDG